MSIRKQGIIAGAILGTVLTTAVAWTGINEWRPLRDSGLGDYPGKATATEPKSTRPASQVLVNEDFSSGEIPNGWHPVEGKWRVVNGALQSKTGDPRARIQFGPMSPRNYRIETTIRFLEVKNGSRWLNIGLDYHVDKDWGAVLVVRSKTTARNGLELAQRQRYAKDFISYPVKNSPIAVGVGRKHRLAVEVRGRKVDVNLDGEHVFHANNLTRTGGQLGFVINNSTVRFDDVRVTELP